jgi:hypothetical protein
MIPLGVPLSPPEWIPIWIWIFLALVFFALLVDRFSE